MNCYGTVFNSIYACFYKWSLCDAFWTIISVRDLFHLLDSHIYIFLFILYLHHLVPWPSTLLVSSHAVAEHFCTQWTRLCSRAEFFLGLDMHKHLTCYIVLSDLFCTFIVFDVFLSLLCLLAGAQNFVWVNYFIIQCWYLFSQNCSRFQWCKWNKIMSWLECESCYSNSQPDVTQICNKLLVK